MLSKWAKTNLAPRRRRRWPRHLDSQHLDSQHYPAPVVAASDLRLVATSMPQQEKSRMFEQSRQSVKADARHFNVIGFSDLKRRNTPLSKIH